jgi:tyrosyl-tRNA synthetase
VTKADGSKFGKSEAGNVWLDPAMTTPFDFYQFWLNTTDADAGRMLKLFSFKSLDDIAALEAELAEDPAGRAAQRALAAELTERVHGADALARAERCTRVLFGDGELSELTAQELGEAFAGAPSTAVPRAHLGQREAGLAGLLAQTGLCPSGRRARQDIKSGAVRINEQQVRDEAYVLDTADVLADAVIVLKRGKKTYHVITLEG